MLRVQLQYQREQEQGRSQQWGKSTLITRITFMLLSRTLYVIRWNKSLRLTIHGKKDRVNRKAHLSVIFSTSYLLNLLPYSRRTNEISALLESHAAWLGRLQTSYPWRWDQYVVPKRRQLTTNLRRVTYQYSPKSRIAAEICFHQLQQSLWGQSRPTGGFERRRELISSNNEISYSDFRGKIYLKCDIKCDKC